MNGLLKASKLSPPNSKIYNVNAGFLVNPCCCKVDMVSLLGQVMIHPQKEKDPRTKNKMVSLSGGFYLDPLSI